MTLPSPWLLAATLLGPLAWGWLVHAVWLRLRPEPRDRDRVAHSAGPVGPKVDYQI